MQRYKLVIPQAPPPAYFIPSEFRSVEQQLPANMFPSGDSYTWSGDSPWTPPSQQELRTLATAPIFHSSEFSQRGVSVASVQATVQDLLAQQLDGDLPLSDPEGRGLSYEVSAALAESLRSSGFNAQMVEVNQEAVGNRLSTTDGDSTSRPAHALVVVHGGDKPIYVDGAVRQWFSDLDPEVRQNATPSVFVGTAEEYAQLMHQFPESLRLTQEDPNAGKYLPGEFAAYLLGEGGGRTELN